MRKIITIIIVSLVMLCGCAENQPKQLTVEILQELVADNFEAQLKIFGGDGLPTADENYQPDWQNPESLIVEVSVERFKNLGEIEAYINSIYSAEISKSILDKGMYLEKDGKLYKDVSKFSPKGYFANTENFIVEITEQSENEAAFIVITTVTEPGELNVSEKYEMVGKAVKENGVWLLDGIVL